MCPNSNGHIELTSNTTNDLKHKNKQELYSLIAQKKTPQKTTVFVPVKAKQSHLSWQKVASVNLSAKNW